MCFERRDLVRGQPPASFAALEFQKYLQPNSISYSYKLILFLFKVVSTRKYPIDILWFQKIAPVRPRTLAKFVVAGQINWESIFRRTRSQSINIFYQQFSYDNIKKNLVDLQKDSRCHELWEKWALVERSRRQQRGKWASRRQQQCFMNWNSNDFQQNQMCLNASRNISAYYLFLNGLARNSRLVVSTYIFALILWLTTNASLWVPCYQYCTNKYFMYIKLFSY